MEMEAWSREVIGKSKVKKVKKNLKKCVTESYFIIMYLREL
jgi:hypothetical protein